jgi:hypothetical protein
MLRVAGIDGYRRSWVAIVLADGLSARAIAARLETPIASLNEVRARLRRAAGFAVFAAAFGQQVPPVTLEVVSSVVGRGGVENPRRVDRSSTRSCAMKDLRALIALLTLLAAWLAFLDRPSGRTFARAILTSVPFIR